MEQILGQILGEVKGIKVKLNNLETKINDLQASQNDFQAGQNDLQAGQKTLVAGQKETYELVKALESRTDTINATLGNLEIQMAHLSGDVKEIKSATEKDQLYVLGRIGKCEKDIFELKQGAGL